MRKPLAVLIVVLLSIAAPTSSWAASPKAGARCSKLGQTVQYQGIKFKCTLSNKKLIWDKGVKTSSGQGQQKPSQVIDPYLISPQEIKTFQDLPTRYKDVKYWAWKRATDAIRNGQGANIPLEVLVGPNSKECSKKGSDAVIAMNNLYVGTKLPIKSTLAYSEKEDDPWLNNTFVRRFPNSNPTQEPNGVNSNFESYVVQTEPCTSISAMTVSGAEIAHGYTHALQKLQYVGSKENWGNVPRWLVEGGATFSENFVQYGQDYKTWITNPGFRNWDLKQYDKSFYMNFFEYKLQSDGKYSWVHTDQWPNQRVYDVGSYACEVLIAIKGPASIIELHREFGITGNFSESFRKVYGISWSDAYPLIADAVYQSTNWVVNSPDGLK
jgi:hypothetical protein